MKKQKLAIGIVAAICLMIGGFAYRNYKDVIEHQRIFDELVHESFDSMSMSYSLTSSYIRSSHSKSVAEASQKYLSNIQWMSSSIKDLELIDNEVDVIHITLRNDRDKFDLKIYDHKYMIIKKNERDYYYHMVWNDNIEGVLKKVYALE